MPSLNELRLKQIVVFAVSTSIFWACYLLAPLAVVLVAHRLLPSIGFLIALPAIPAIWLFPALCSLVVVGVLCFLVGDREEAVSRGWTFGVPLGAGVLTAVWFLPLWQGHWPVAAATLAPLRVSGLFSNAWLTGISWLLAVPMMVYVNLGGAVASIHPSNEGKKQVTRSKSTSDTQAVGTSRSMAQSNARSDNSTASDQSPSNLTYRWDGAPDVGFTDVGGMDGLKSEIERSVLRPLTGTDAAYERFNISPPNGILLYGPPGTGKTHFAQAIAGELSHPYLELSAGDLKSQWINESTEKVTQLFREAERFERCVIFIDEIDALLAERGNDLHHEHAQVVNEFLAHLDAEEPNFLLIAATNQVKRLDEAATRRGRFDQQYEIGLPDREAREAIFRVRLREMPTELGEQEYQQLATRSQGLSSAEIVGLVEDAAVNAAERGGTELRWNDFPLSSKSG